MSNTIIHNDAMYSFLNTMLKLLGELSEVYMPVEFEATYDTIQNSILEWLNPLLKSAPVVDHLKQIAITNGNRSYYVISWHKNGLIMFHKVTGVASLPFYIGYEPDRLIKGKPFTVKETAAETKPKTATAKPKDITLEHQIKTNVDSLFDATIPAINKAYLREKIAGEHHIPLKKPAAIKKRILKYKADFEKTLKAEYTRINEVRKTAFEFMYQPDIIEDYVTDAYDTTCKYIETNGCWGGDLDTAFAKIVNSSSDGRLFTPGLNSSVHYYYRDDAPIEMLKKYNISDDSDGQTTFPLNLEQTLVSFYPEIFKKQKINGSFTSGNYITSPLFRAGYEWQKIHEAARAYLTSIPETTSPRCMKTDHLQPEIKAEFDKNPYMALDIIMTPNKNLIDCSRKECITREHGYSAYAYFREIRYESSTILSMKPHQNNLYSNNFITWNHENRLDYDATVNGGHNTMLHSFWSQAIRSLLLSYHKTQTFDKELLKELIDKQIEMWFPLTADYVEQCGNALHLLRNESPILANLSNKIIISHIQSIRADANKLIKAIDEMQQTLLKSTDIEYLQWLKKEKQIDADEADKRIAQLEKLAKKVKSKTQAKTKA